MVKLKIYTNSSSSIPLTYIHVTMSHLDSTYFKLAKAPLDRCRQSRLDYAMPPDLRGSVLLEGPSCQKFQTMYDF